MQLSLAPHHHKSSCFGWVGNSVGRSLPDTGTRTRPRAALHKLPKFKHMHAIFNIMIGKSSNKYSTPHTHTRVSYQHTSNSTT